MSFIAEEDIKGQGNVNLAPMIDFLFLMVVFFATLAVSRIATRDTELDLVKIQTQQPAKQVAKDSELKVVNVTIDSAGGYKWVTDIHDYPMDSAQAIAKELQTQHQKGLLPSDKSKIHVLLKIDKEAQWDPIMQVVFAIREAGFSVRPVYQPESAES